MPDANKNISRFTLLLALIAGYSDTATFVGANGTFSAHVTGNFIVFAAQVVLSSDRMAWIKLITFPVFVAAVITAGWLAAKSGKKTLLLWEGILLVAAGICAYTLKDNFWYKNAVVMLMVLAMGLQNGFGRLFPAEVFGPTTMMTGNVTQAALDFRNLLIGKSADKTAIRQNLKKHAVLLGGFLAGCLLGGLFTRGIGLASAILPGLLIFGAWLFEKKPETNTSTIP
jgi:uncharacterized membrane protein YoaK (UPF0700 family)